ncbi:MAG: tRNA (guanosine(46)-N7)-methyltransferase TrmB [Clostridia bacterium]|nr:tRNA (guanosine(46)-N7)-methyltransferase TrmB [Clostridia bacterium]
MRIRRKKWARPELDICPYFEKSPESRMGSWKECFGKNQPFFVELGCGKGTFAAKLGLDNPDVNILALDIKSDMLGNARRNISALYSENGRSVSNIMLTAYNVEHLEKILCPQDNVQRIYINFCNPWPKPKHKKRRLTYPNKLQKYYELLPAGGEIRFKTDDLPLFNDSLEYFAQSGFEVVYKTYDLHRSDITDNILTEHEIMFSEQGIKINYCRAVKVEKSNISE